MPGAHLSHGVVLLEVGPKLSAQHTCREGVSLSAWVAHLGGCTTLPSTQCQEVSGMMG